MSSRKSRQTRPKSRTNANEDAFARNDNPAVQSNGNGFEFEVNRGDVARPTIAIIAQTSKQLLDPIDAIPKCESNGKQRKACFFDRIAHRVCIESPQVCVLLKRRQLLQPVC